MPRVPRLPSRASASSTKLAPSEAFLVSQVDGTLDENELALMTGSTPEQVHATIDRLVSLGALEIGEDRAVGQTPPGPARSAPQPAIPAARPSQPGAAADDTADLDSAKRARIDELWARLDELTYYELLGVAVDAEKKQVKAAYYALAPDFHPDRFFRKQLGDYKHRIEGIFGRITLAHDVLTVPERRAEYDAYLEQTRMNRSTAAVLDRTDEELKAFLGDDSPPLISPPPARSWGTPPPRPQASTPAPFGRSPVAQDGGRPHTVAQDGGRPHAPGPPAEPISPEEALRLRREALARKLLGGRVARPAAPATTAPPVQDRAAAARAAEAMRAHRERSLGDAKRTQVARSLETAKAALDAQEWATAANAYRVAASLDPDDLATQAICTDALQTVAAALAEGYLKQGGYEESQGRWAEAALSFSKVCTGRPNDPAIHDRVARVTIKARTNPRRAVEYARKAIELEPRKVEYRVTLASAYAAAGMENSASSELDRALEIAPKDPRVASLVASARAAIATARPLSPSSLPPPASRMTPTKRPSQSSFVPPSARVPASESSPSMAAVTGPPAYAASPLPPKPADAPKSADVPKKTSGLHALVSAVRSALAPKEGK